jgi:hypothetical protein
VITYQLNGVEWIEIVVVIVVSFLWGWRLGRQYRSLVRDRPSFVSAIREWEPVLKAMPHLQTARDWRRLKNRTRFLAMHARARSERRWHERVESWWQRTRLWLMTRSWPSDESIQIDDGLATRLQLFDVATDGLVSRRIRVVLGLATTPETDKELGVELAIPDILVSHLRQFTNKLDRASRIRLESVSSSSSKDWLRTYALVTNQPLLANFDDAEVSRLLLQLSYDDTGQERNARTLCIQWLDLHAPLEDVSGGMKTDRRKKRKRHPSPHRYWMHRADGPSAAV